MKLSKCILFYLLGTILLPPLSQAAGKKKGAENADKLTLTVYSARNEQLMQPLLDAYQNKNPGIHFELRTDKEAPLVQRLLSEGESTPADLLVTVDAGNLWFAAEQGVLQSFDSQTLNTRIPSRYRDPKNRWFGLSLRARPIFYNPAKVKTSQLESYEGLADSKWKDRLCLRTSKKVYNQSLVATLIKAHGEKSTEKTIRAWVANLAATPFPDDTAVLKAIASGQCDVGIANTYYLGRLIKDDPSFADKVKVFWPNQKSRGAHVNVSGAGIVKNASHPKEAGAFIEWLSSNEAQKIFAGLNLEYPAVDGVEQDPIVQKWGQFKADLVNLEVAGKLQATAVKLMNRAGYN